MKKILLTPVETTIYGFSSQAYSLSQGMPETLIGRNICSLTAPEKEHPLIKKLLGGIRKPSFKELDEINRNFRVCVASGVCHLFAENDAGVEEKTFNLGTIETPAFFYDKFIFVLDRRKKVFVPVDVNVVCYTDNYVLMLIGGDLLIKFDVKGLKCVGNFVSATKVARGYIIVALDTNGSETVYAAHKNIQTLFETDVLSAFKIDAESGNVTHEYTDMSTIPVGQVTDIYVSTAKGYILADHDVE